LPSADPDHLAGKSQHPSRNIDIRRPATVSGVTTTPLKRRVGQQRKGDQRETDLIRCAERHLDEGSFASASVAELAAAAGVSRPTFYFYFASKEALLASVIDTAHAEIAERLITALDQPAPPADRLAATIRAGADAWWEHRAAMSAAMQLAQRVPELGERMRASMREVNERCTDLLTAHGTVPERHDRTAARNLVETLALMNERVFSHEVPRARSRHQLAPVEERLLLIWTRTMGIENRRRASRSAWVEHSP
jgi:AcrR family transcriptional regulator